MTRKVIIYLVIVFCVVTSALLFVLTGFIAAENEVFPYSWLKPVVKIATTESASNQRTLPEAPDMNGKWFALNEGDQTGFDGLGYLGSYKQSSLSGVVKSDSNQYSPGLNLYVSGHGPEATLVDMDGSVVHKWKLPWENVFSGSGEKNGDYWLKSHLYPNGDLLVIYKGIGLVKLNRNSDVLWAKPIRAHHDIWVSEKGEIYVLTRKRIKLRDFRVTRPFKNRVKNREVLSDFITVLNPKGRTIREYSLLEIMKQSRFAPLLKLLHHTDVFHTNTLEIITDPPPGSHEALQEGRAIISMRRLNFIGVVDLEKATIPWGRSSRWLGQHDPRILSNGNLLIYDNRRGGNYSRILEFNPRTDRVEWSFRGTSETPFYSSIGGRNQPLPNGNVLITSTTSGRAFEVTRNGEIVWDYYNPNRLERDNQSYIAAMYDMQRFSRNYFGSWLTPNTEKSR